jgi:hypothetical protein
VRSTDAPGPDGYLRFPEQPIDPRRAAGTFERLGLPQHLNGSLTRAAAAGFANGRAR